MASIFKSVCVTKVVDDGLIFCPILFGQLRFEKEQLLPGYSCNFRRAPWPCADSIAGGCRLWGCDDSRRLKPDEFPPLLNFPAARLPMYARETAIAEKFETIVKLGLVNIG